jgi:UDP-N-acetylglucosamine 2-epimerase
VPVVNIGTRQTGRERGKNVVDVGYCKNEIRAAVERQMENGRYGLDNLYGDGDAGERISQVLAQVPLEIEKRLTY